MSYILDYSNWKRVFEQATVDSSTVEKAMIAWWTNPPKDKEDSAKKSLGYWTGQIDPVTLKYTDNLITHLTVLSKANSVFNSQTVAKVLDYVTKQKAAGVYIKAISAASGQLESVLSALSKLETNAQVWAGTKKAIDPMVVAFNKPDAFTQISKILEANKKIVTAITPEDKASMIAKITERATAHAKAKGSTVEEAIKKAVSLWVRPSEGTSTTTTVLDSPKELVGYEFSYPDKNKPGDNLMQNFFDDNESTPTADQIQKFTDLVKTAISEVTKSGANITEIKYYAGGITSKGGTKYLGKGKLDTSWKSENNEILVRDRIAELNAVLLKVLTDNLPAGTTITKGTDESVPNDGPGWYEYSTKNSKGESVFAYGPLYEAARKANKNLIPKDFYAKRTTDSAIKEEYDTVFGKFRGSYGAFLIKAEVTPIEPGETLEISASGKWKATIDWKYREPVKFKFNLGSTGGGGKAYPGGSSPTACWIH